MRLAAFVYSAVMLYSTLLFLHILAMAIWIGASTALTIMLARAERSKDPGLMQALGAEAEFFSKKVFIPASLVVLATGVWLVIEGPYDWEDPFVVMGLITVLAAVLLGPLVMAPTTSKLRAVMAEHGVAHESIGRLKRRLKLGSRFLLLLLLITMYMMVAKPGI